MIGEFRKERPTTFVGEVKLGQEAEAWLLRMRKNFQVHDYSRNVKARISIFNLNGRESIWWAHLNKVKRIKERKIAWKQFKRYFQ